MGADILIARLSLLSSARRRSSWNVVGTSKSPANFTLAFDVTVETTDRKLSFTTELVSAVASSLNWSLAVTITENSLAMKRAFYV